MKNDGVFLLILVIALAMVSFVAGRMNRESEEIDKETSVQLRVDSVKSYRYKELADSISIENKALKEANEKIINVKKLIRDELQIQRTKIDNIPDSLLRRIVDSLLLSR